MSDTDKSLEPQPAEPPATCPSCHKPDAKWTDAELRRGKRFRFGALEYHCMAAYYELQ